MAPNGNKNDLSPLNPGYENLDPAFYTGFAYSPDGGAAEAAIDYFGQSASTAYPTSALTSPDWPVLDTFSPLGAVPYFSAGSYMSPGLGAETDSETDPFSPVDPLPGLDHMTGQWSWSQPSSPSLGPDSTPSSTQAARASATRSSKSSRSKAQAKLRTASRKPRKSDKSSRSASSPSEGDAGEDNVTPEELRARRNHNLVEKQYRNRLNAQFERLLAVLPADQRGGQGDSEDSKRMSKAEVLDVATRRIKELEVERRRLLKERRDLLQNMEVMNGVVSGVSRR
ncbi:hypothetical protein OQA88_2916 [Cercophora sp. LCS_1]